MESKDLNRTKARLVIMAIFVFGFVGGALSMNLYTRATATTKPVDVATPRHYFFDSLNDKCKLTTDQQAQIHAICDDTFNKFHDIGKQVQPQMDQARQEGRDRIRAVLTKDQLPKFEELLVEMDKRRQERSEHK
jgi:hypothetical protein